MKRLLVTFILLIFVKTSCFSQQILYLKGFVLGFNHPVSNATIFNYLTKNGTVSNENGMFEIPVRLNDTIEISSLQFEVVKIIIDAKIYKNKFVTVNLTARVVQLEEIYLNKLIGSLLFDIANQPKDSTPKQNFSLKRVDLKVKPIESSYDLSKPPNADKITNPIQMFGVGGKARIPAWQYEKEKIFKAKLRQKKEFPRKIIQQFGVAFFTERLDIANENIPNFLSYCEYRNIIELYNNKQYFKLIQILQEESKYYNNIKR